MSQTRRLIYYILLNVFISACVTGTILFWYDRNIRATSAPSVSRQTQPEPAAANPQPTSRPAKGNTPSPQQDIPIQIASVVGAGTLEAEVVIIHYVGDGSLDLTNWQLKDEHGNLYLFPALTLVNDGAVQVHTASGTDTVVDLYWGMRDPVWKSGETASLFDAQGTLRAVYKVP